jgi:hypothetical protein
MLIRRAHLRVDNPTSAGDRQASGFGEGGAGADACFQKHEFSGDCGCVAQFDG